MRLQIVQRATKQVSGGFTIEGPFSFSDGTADITYTKDLGGQSAEGRLQLRNGRAVITSGGTKTILNEADETLGIDGGASTLQDLPVGRWMRDPKVTDGGVVGGTRTDRITADLNIVPAVNDLIATATSPGQKPIVIDGAAARRLEQAATSGVIELWTGKQDRLLRRLVMKASFALEVPEELKRLVGELVGTDVELVLELTDPRT